MQTHIYGVICLLQADIMITKWYVAFVCHGDQHSAGETFDYPRADTDLFATFLQTVSH